MKYRVTINCVAVEDVEAFGDEEAETIARDIVDLGDCDILWVGVEGIGDEEEES